MQAAILGANRAAVVGRSVVDKYNLDIGRTLAKQTVDALGQIAGLVIHRYYNRYERALRHFIITGTEGSDSLFMRSSAVITYTPASVGL